MIPFDFNIELTVKFLLSGCFLSYIFDVCTQSSFWFPAGKMGQKLYVRVQSNWWRLSLTLTGLHSFTSVWRAPSAEM